MHDTNPATDRLQTQRPLERHQQLEVDAFCDACGYNLHGQLVTRDERLGIMIARCPECGRFHAAGKGTSAQAIWLSRWATGMLTLWVMFCVCFILLATILLGVAQYGHLEMFTEYGQFSPDGQPLEFNYNANAVGGQGNWVIAGTTQPAPSATVHRRVVRGAYSLQHHYAPGYSPTMYEPGWEQLTALALFWGTTAFVLGAFIAIAMWHVPKRRYAWAILLPVAAGAFILWVWWVDDMTEWVRGWAVPRVAVYVALEAGVLMLGTLLGRPIARGLARLFVPPKPRQVLAFLWRADGLEPPKAGT
ncbi:MAG: hypothetical protein ACREIT_04290 [Tepidisphaeraceae bacterium]